MYTGESDAKKMATTPKEKMPRTHQRTSVCAIPKGRRRQRLRRVSSLPTSAFPGPSVSGEERMPGAREKGYGGCAHEGGNREKAGIRTTRRGRKKAMKGRETSTDALEYCM